MTESEWRIYVCADCDEDDPFRFAQVVPAGAEHGWAPDMDHCPRCGGHLPFTASSVGETIVLRRTQGYGDLPVPANGRV